MLSLYPGPSILSSPRRNPAGKRNVPARRDADEPITPARPVVKNDLSTVLDLSDREIVGTEGSSVRPKVLSMRRAALAPSVDHVDVTHAVLRLLCPHCIRGWRSCQGNRFLLCPRPVPATDGHPVSSSSSVVKDRYRRPPQSPCPSGLPGRRPRGDSPQTGSPRHRSSAGTRRFRGPLGQYHPFRPPSRSGRR